MISQSNHVKFACFVLLAVSEEAKNMNFIFSVQCVIKQLLDRFCDIQYNRGLGKGYQPQPLASVSAGNPYLDLDYSGYHKNLIQ